MNKLRWNLQVCVRVNSQKNPTKQPTNKPTKQKTTVRALRWWNHHLEEWEMPHHQGAQTRFNTGVGCEGLFEPGQFSRSHGCPCYLMLAFSSLGVWYLEQWRFLVSMWREHSLSAGGRCLACRRGNRAAQLGRLAQLRGMGLVGRGWISFCTT